MAQQTIGIGTIANDGTGDPLRTAMDKVNDNFDELYTSGGPSHTQAASTITADAVQTPSFADPLPLDGTTYKNFKVTVTASTTVNLTGVVDGDAGSIELIISGAGGYTITMGTMFTKKLGSTSIVATTGADNFISWMKSGTDIIYTIIQTV